MAITAYGLITLTPLTVAVGGPLQFTSDPDSYVRTWRKRRSYSRGLDGAGTTQDFGRPARDCVIALAWSGTGTLLNKADVQVLKAWEAATGATFQFTDGEGNDFAVEIVGVDDVPIFGLPDLYACKLELQVLTMTTYLGSPYMGA